ncbi:putative T-cell immunomodulatory protein [Apostichopus japonicus]|uniref:Putative T-cell immunomodulatory protein n=1 Tax=Stichopus japonicus TaxID=307972 RepID=A0A2G8K311_STIJA|nr:putative T-cell immunomodulatory protein [Apostichopus japonicus]
MHTAFVASLQLEKKPANNSDKQMKLFFLAYVFLLCGWTRGQELFPGKITLVDSTDIYLGDDNFGTIAAFGDYNGDGSPDLFIISDNEHEVTVQSKSDSGKQWYAPDKKPKVSWPNNTIVSVTPSDFTGDKITDLLVIILTDDDDLESIAAYMHAGNDKLEFGEPILVSDQLLNQPLVADYNYDMVADVFGATKNGDLKFWVFKNKEDGFEERLVKSAERNLAPVNYAFINLNSDMNTHLFITSDNGKGLVYETWNVTEADDGLITWQFRDSHFLKRDGYIGISTFVDIDADGYLDQVVPVCLDDACVQSGIKYYSGKGKDWVDIMTAEDLLGWHFPSPKDIPAWRRITAGFQLRSGDFNLDSYTDFTCIMRKGANETNEVVILINDGGLGLTLNRVPATNSNKSPFVAAFVDMSMTAHMDIVVGTETEEGNMYHLMTNTFSPDANFIKVEVVQRTCAKCSGSHVSNQPGPVTKYETTTPAVRGSNSESAYLALQLPYVIMGLSQNPNFVDVVSVSIPNKCCDIQVQRSNSWLSLIPNSQLVVYPREDDKQKRQEAHKFHFDAM